MPPPEPPMVARLPHDKHGRPVPWFVHRADDGTPDFRVVRPGGIPDAVRRNLCWVCGTDRGREAAFVIGPMCAVGRVISEPPSHRVCATYSALACPFLTTPRMRRRESGLPEGGWTAGNAIKRNPGVACVWFTNKFDIVAAPGGGVLFEIGAPSRVSWYAEGRRATREEVLASIDSGYHLLVEEAERDGPAALAELAQRRGNTLALLPPALSRSG